MGQILHGSATTTEAVRGAIQHSQESLRGLAKPYGVNPKTVAKWKARSSVSDLPTGPKQPRSTVLSAEERRAKRFGAKTLAPYGRAACSALARRYSLRRPIDARIEGKPNVYARSGLQSRSAEILSARSADPFIVHDVEAEALVLIQAGHSCAFDGAYIDEHVNSTVVGLEETIALTDVEPSDSSHCHSALPRMWRPPAGRLARMRPARHAACASSHAAGQARRGGDEGGPTRQDEPAAGRAGRHATACVGTKPGASANNDSVNKWSAGHCHI